MDNLLRDLLRGVWAIVHVDYYLHGLPWHLKAFVYISACLSQTVMFAIPHKWLRWFVIKTWPWFKADAVTGYRVPITLAGYIVYVSDCSHFWGVWIMVLGLLLDRMDGFIAEVMDLLQSVVYIGYSLYGKILDPMADKWCLVPILWYEVHSGYLPWLQVAIMTGFELIGTVVRPPFINRKWRNRKYRWVVVVLRRRLRSPKASVFGKVKMALQCATVLMIVPYRLEWLVGDRIWLHKLMWYVVVFAALSVVFRFKYHKYVDGVMAPMDEFFAHLPGNGKKNPGKGKGNGTV